jgi:hypothetical protein
MNKVIRFLTATTFVVFASSASAGIIPVPYGELDTLVISASGIYTNPDDFSTTPCGTGSLTCEKTWVAAVLGIDFDDLDYTKIDNQPTNWFAVDDGDASTDIFAFDLLVNADITVAPDYFAFKSGGGSTEGDLFLFENKANYQFAMIDLTLLGVSTIGNFGAVSHFGVVAGTPDEPNCIPGTSECPNDVPEPSIIALFGLGLVGLGLARRKTRS